MTVPRWLHMPKACPYDLMYATLVYMKAQRIMGWLLSIYDTEAAAPGSETQKRPEKPDATETASTF